MALNDKFCPLCGILWTYRQCLDESNISSDNRRRTERATRSSFGVSHNNTRTCLSRIYPRQFDRDGLRTKDKSHTYTKIIAQNGEIFSSRRGVIYIAWTAYNKSTCARRRELSIA